MQNLVDITAAFKTIPWFFDLSSESTQRLASIAEVKAYQQGEIIFKEGDQHPYLYIIVQGKILLESLIPGHGVIPIFTAEALDVIGWSSLTPVVRQKTCTARVLEKANLLSFEADSLIRVCESDHELGFIVMRRLANIVASRFLTHRLQLLELLADFRQ
jgi:CRP-like cAMP-binding protein